MNPQVWGPSFWFVMHTVSLNYPDDPSYTDRRTHYDFYHIIRDVLPCVMCRQHYTELLEQFPVQPFLDSKTSLVSWVVMIHNQVNKRLDKPMIDREEMLANYQQVYARGSFCDPACPAASKEDGGGGETLAGHTARSHARTRRALLIVSIVLAALVILLTLAVVWGVRRWRSLRAV